MGKNNFKFKVGNNEVSQEEFISTYNESYYLDNDKRYYKRQCKNSKYIECEIEKLLNKNNYNCEDIYKILAWKMGKIRHKCSQKNSKFSYYKNCDEEKFTFCGNGNFSEFISFIVKNQKELKEKSSDPKDFLEYIIKKCDKRVLKGIGTVYMITLLYFFSGGVWPIYDRFAAYAVADILGEKNKSQKDFVLSEKHTKEFCNESLSDGVYQVYCKKLEKIFGTKSICRDIDRALWVYGHCCKPQK